MINSGRYNRTLPESIGDRPTTREHAAGCCRLIRHANDMQMICKYCWNALD